MARQRDGRDATKLSTGGAQDNVNWAFGLVNSVTGDMVSGAFGDPPDTAGFPSPQAAPGPGRQIVFIDGNVPDAKLLAAGVAPGVTAVILDPNEDGVRQIAAWLAGHDNGHLAAIDIVAHGADGLLKLGTAELDAGTIGQYEGALATIGAALQPGGAIQLYGCDVAQDAAGDAFLQQLSQAAGGANVAASSGLVGLAAEGGSWTLNVDVGAVTAGDPFTAATQVAFPDVLAAPTDKIIFLSSDQAAGANAVGTRIEQFSATGGAFVAGSTVDIADGSLNSGLATSPSGFAVDAALNKFFVLVDNPTNHAITIQRGTPLAAGSTLSTFATIPFQDLTGSGSTVATVGLMALDPVGGELYYAQAGVASDGNAAAAATGIYKVSIAGSTGTPALFTPSSNTLFNPLAVALDVPDNLLFFTDAFASTESSTGAAGTAGPLPSVNNLDVANLNTGSITILHSFTSQEVDPDFVLQGLAVDPVNHNIYLTSIGDFETNTSTNNAIYKIPFTPTGSGSSATASLGAISTLYSGAGAFQPNDIAIDPAQGIFYASGGTIISGDTIGAVFEGSLSGGSSLTLVEPLTSIVAGGTTGPAENDIIPQLVVLTAPTVTASGTVGTVSGGGTVTADPGATVTEQDSQLLTGATVSGVLAGDTLSYNGGAPHIFTDGFTISSSFSGGILTLSGNASAADYQSAVDAVAFSSTSSNATPRTLAWTVSDASFSSATSNSTVNVHVAPTVVAGASATFNGGGAAVALDSGLSISDASSGTLISATVVDSGFISGDTLTVGTAGGLSTSFSNGTLTLTGNASLATYQTALESVDYGFTAGGDPTGGGGHTSRTIDWTVNDGTLASAQVTSTLNVAHTAPTIAAAGTVTFNGGGSPVVLDSTAAATDPDSGGNLVSATVAIGGFISGDTLTVGTPGGLGTSFTNGTLTLTGTASLATYNAALDSVDYGFSPSNGDPTGGGTHTSRTISWSVKDSVAASNTGASTLNVVHTPPTISAGGKVNFVAGTPVVLDPTATATDPDSAGQLTGATIIVNGGTFAGDGDVLSGNTAGTNITLTASGETVTLSGTDTLADYNAVLDSITFNDTAADPSNGGADKVRTITWTVTDGVATSVAATSSVNVACFCAGALIATPDGEVPVERIAAGLTVFALDGKRSVPVRVKWVGHRRLDLTAHPNSADDAPVRIDRGAFGDGLPRRDLMLSPDHCVFVEGKLIPIKLLTNGMTIARRREISAVTYYHIELDRHSVLLAEGLPVESYLDTGNRTFFANASVVSMHAVLEASPAALYAANGACAALEVRPSAVEPVWRQLTERAEALGYIPPTAVVTQDADPHLRVDGRVVRPLVVEGERHTFLLPRGVSEVRLASRVSVPSETAPYLDDPRHLGVAVRRVVLRSVSGQNEIPADHPALSLGWHQAEGDDKARWRWTNGDARLPIEPEHGPLIVDVYAWRAETYPLVDHEIADRPARVHGQARRGRG